MRQALAAGIIAAAVGAAGCTSNRAAAEPGPVVERNFTVGTFDKIELAGAYDATVRTGSAPTVQAKGGEKLLGELVVEVRDGTLYIRPRDKRSFNWGSGRNRGKVELLITVPSLRAAELAGSGGIHIDKVTGDSFEGGVAGSGDLEVAQIDVGTLKIGIAGSGDARAAGRARSAELEIAGSGGIDAGGVVTEEAEVSIAGSGNVSANASKTAKVSIAGSGNVDLSGGAKCDISKMGSGIVRCS